MIESEEIQGLTRYEPDSSMRLTERSDEPDVKLDSLPRQSLRASAAVSPRGCSPLPRGAMVLEHRVDRRWVMPFACAGRI